MRYGGKSQRSQEISSGRGDAAEVTSPAGRATRGARCARGSARRANARRARGALEMRRRAVPRPRVTASRPSARATGRRRTKFWHHATPLAEGQQNGTASRHPSALAARGLGRWTIVASQKAPARELARPVSNSSGDSRAPFGGARVEQQQRANAPRSPLPGSMRTAAIVARLGVSPPPPRGPGRGVGRKSDKAKHGGQGTRAPAAGSLPQRGTAAPPGRAPASCARRPR